MGGCCFSLVGGFTVRGAVLIQSMWHRVYDFGLMSEVCPLIYTWRQEEYRVFTSGLLGDSGS